MSAFKQKPNKVKHLTELHQEKMVNNIPQEPEILEKKKYPSRRVMHLEEKLDENKLKIPLDIKKKIIKMFKTMQQSADTYNRHSAMYCPYVINKLFGILELPEYAEHYDLKNRP